MCGFAANSPAQQKKVSEKPLPNLILKLNLPLDNLGNNLSKLDKDKPVYVICQTGRRSQKGAEILQKAGFSDLYNINGGTSEWIKAGFPTEK